MPAASEQLHILHLVAGSDAGGVSRYLIDLSTAMVNRGHRVTIAGERGAWHDRFTNGPWEWLDLPLKGNALQLFGAAKRISRWLAQNRVDVIHIHYRRPALIAAMAGRWWRDASGKRVPVLYTLHLSHISVRGPRRWVSFFGDHTHVAAEAARQWLVDEKLVPPDRISVIPHGIDPDRFPIRTEADYQSSRAALGFSQAETVAAYVGRFDDPKNVDWLIDLAVATRDKLPALRILLLGEGPHETRLRQRIQQEKLDQRVRILATQDPLPIYQAIDALLLPSQREGFSLVCAEAMSVGVPVLRTRTSGTEEMIVEGTTGRSVAIEHDAFIDEAIAFVSDRSALLRVGLAAARHVRNQLLFTEQVSRTINLYEDLSK